MLTKLIQDHVSEVIEQSEWDTEKEKEEAGRTLLGKVSRQWNDVSRYVVKNNKPKP